MIHDATQCALGEGPLWHPEREQFFWFDILGKRLLSAAQSWQFEEYVSAAGWVDRDTLLIASETKLFTYNLVSGAKDRIAPLENDNSVTRSNDGRADPYGGFWIGTMGKAAETHAGAIYRYYRGELREIYAEVTIPNAICFDPSGKFAYYTDTPTGKLMRTGLDASGWPDGSFNVAIDLSDEDFGIDGAVVDVDGNIWNAQWGAGRVAQYAPDGTFLQAIPFPAKQTSCPAFGGTNLTTLYCTSATQGMDHPGPDDGKTFAVPTTHTGQKEHRVIL
ncbi:MAG: SMP-30/gluconolactonase/LRE family protein [Pseudomonadota bacterium]